MCVIDKDKIIYNLENEIVIDDYIVKVEEEVQKKLRIVFMGTPSFAVPILDGLIEHYEVVLVVCQPDRKKDRKGNMLVPETKQLAINKGIEFFQPLKIREDYQLVLDKKPDMIVTCAYGQIIPKELLEYPKYGCINVHGSLLPKLRGGAPIHHAIINGYQETGMTVMKMSEKMDAGDIISQKSLLIGEDEILDSLYQRMSVLGKDLLLETIPSIVDGSAKYIAQNENDVTFGFNVRREEEKINFSKTNKEIHNLVRGLNSVPGAYAVLDGKRMKIYQVVTLNKDYFAGKFGEIVAVEQDGMVVQCGDGCIKILEIALEGKKRCLIKDYFNGVRRESLIGKVFE